tara:strand:+ start:52 stop:153 length:102 start_codon:yes stop_codon:yes gene_type:complete
MKDPTARAYLENREVDEDSMEAYVVGDDEASSI